VNHMALWAYPAAIFLQCRFPELTRVLALTAKDAFDWIWFEFLSEPSGTASGTASGVKGLKGSLASLRPSY